MPQAAIPTPASTPDQVFADGGLVITPNNRLARSLVDRYDQRQRAQGSAVWASARALPWTTFLTRLWNDALAADAFATPQVLLGDAQVLHLWERAVAADNLPLLDARGAAELAASAWQVFHDYASPDETLAALAVRGDDAATFVRWARRYAAACRQADALDGATLTQALVAAAARGAWLCGRRIVLAGFVSYTPAQERLLAALMAAGADVLRLAWPVADPASPSVQQRAAFATPRDEMAAALEWARLATQADPQAVVGIAVADLSTRVADISALADDILCPQAYQPGGLASPRPWNISLGASLAMHPLVATALDVLALAATPLPLAAACALVRSPFLVRGTQLAAQRAQAEGLWRNANVHDVGLRRLQAALPAADPLRASLDALDATLRSPTSVSPHAWAGHFRAALAAVGWPGDAALGSDAFQARDAWDRALATFATLALVGPGLRRGGALAALRAIVTRTLFQPERPGARVQIVGLLEAAGLAFDRLWLAGVAADAWPPAVQPDPLLPPAWQRAHGYAPADPLQTLARARALTAQLAAGAPQVMASHVLSDDDPPRAVSPLCAWTLVDMPVPVLLATRIQHHAPLLEVIEDRRLPALPADARIRGGVRVVELQSDCPFRAAAALRLGAEPWPRPAIGLSAIERGTLLHAALAAFWNDVRDHATLSTLAEEGSEVLRARIALSVDAARAVVERQRWHELPAGVAANEHARLVDLIERWLMTQELPRQPFAVVAVEQAAQLTIGSLPLRFKLDRIDRLLPQADGGIERLAIIDYKTGRTDAVGNWVLPRPVAPQGGLYALAVQAAQPEAQVDAVALAQLKAGALRSRGLANGTAGWPGLTYPGTLGDGRFVDLADVTAFWHERFAALAQAFRAGDAAVAPRAKPLPCTHCAFKPICRIGALASAADAIALADDGQEDAA